MYAIVKSGGKQFKIEQKAVIRVPSLKAGIGEKVQLDEILFLSDGDKVEAGSPFIEGAYAEAVVVRHGRSRKIRIIKYKRRKGYRRTIGHRQAFTELEIGRIVVGAKKKPAAAQKKEAEKLAKEIKAPVEKKAAVAAEIQPAVKPKKAKAVKKVEKAKAEPAKAVPKTEKPKAARKTAAAKEKAAPAVKEKKPAGAAGKTKKAAEKKDKAQTGAKAKPASRAKAKKPAAGTKPGAKKEAAGKAGPKKETAARKKTGSAGKAAEKGEKA